MKKQLRTPFFYGTTLIESLVVVFVFSVMTLTFYSAYSLGMTRILDAQKRLQAMALATEQIEKFRNLAYEDVGFDGGVPVCSTHCVIEPNETRSIGPVTFFIDTSIHYQDDVEDGTLAGGTDSVPNDYKRVTVSVEWGDRSVERHVEMTSRFVPPGIEQEIPNSGALSINVYDYSGDPVSGVRAEITGVAGNFFTDNTGNIFLLGVPVSVAGYPIRLTKSGYETSETLPFPPVGAFPPKYPPVVVADNVINVGNFEVNPLTDITFQVKDSFGNTLSDIDFLVSGGRRLDNNALPTNYEYSNEPQRSDGSGDIHLTDRSGGSYTFSLDPSETEYVLWKTSISLDDPLKPQFPYGGTHTEDIILIRRSSPGIWIKVTEDTSGSVLPGVTVQVTGNAGLYDETQLTDQFGYVYFPEDENGLVVGGTYAVHVEYTGYHENDSSVTVSGLEEETIALQAN